MTQTDDAFFGAAKRIGLTAEEKSAILKNVRNAVRNQAPTRHQVSMNDRDFFASAQAIRLTPAERVSVREYLHSVMHAGADGHWWLHPFKSFASVTASILIVSIAGAGVSYAAEAAMPGDLLYPVKMHVNERLEVRLARTAKARAGIAAKHTEKRLKEAEMLMQHAALDEEKQTMLAAEVEKNVNVVQTEVLSLMEEHDMDGAGEISMSLEATLGAHAKFLGAGATKSREGIGHLLATLHEARMAMEETAIAATMESDDITRVADAAVTNAIASATAEIGMTDQLVKNPEAEERLSVARNVLAETNPDRGLPSRERLRYARSALRKAKEAAIIARMPPEDSPEPAAAPTMMMMKMDAASAPVDDAYATGEDEDEMEDIHFETSVRMRMAEKKIEKTELKLKRHGEEMPEGKTQPVKTRMEGSKLLMDTAKMQMDAGMMNEALDASDAALKHADKAERDLGEMMPDSEE